jgi:hypothetical protein
LQKLGCTSIFLIMAALLSLATMVQGQNWLDSAPMLRLIGSVLLNIGWAFVLSGLVLLWWQPEWLQNAYVKAERNLVWAYYGLLVAVGLILSWGAVQSIL